MKLYALKYASSNLVFGFWCYTDFLIAAPDEDTARKLANEEANREDEGRKIPNPWLTPGITLCAEIAPESIFDEPAIIFSNFRD
ncbi:MAG: hypothetical protein ABFD50_00915 [Smithella sp.]